MWSTSTQPASARRPETRWRFHLSRCPGFGVHFYPARPDGRLGDRCIQQETTAPALKRHRIRDEPKVRPIWRETLDGSCSGRVRRADRREDVVRSLNSLARTEFKGQRRLVMASAHRTASPARPLGRRSDLRSRRATRAPKVMEPEPTSCTIPRGGGGHLSARRWGHRWAGRRPGLSVAPHATVDSHDIPFGNDEQPRHLAPGVAVDSLAQAGWTTGSRDEFEHPRDLSLLPRFSGLPGAGRGDCGCCPGRAFHAKTS